MNYQGWDKLSLITQLANIGSEVERAIRWRQKGNTAYAQLAFERSLELLDLTMKSPLPFPKIKEIARVRAALVDDFAGTNTFGSSDIAWHRYFAAFTYRARVTHR